MKLKEVIDTYTQCNKFEIQVIDKKVKIYYYDAIENFTSNMILIKNADAIIKIIGKNLVIETMFKEYVIISGKIFKIEFEGSNE